MKISDDYSAKFEIWAKERKIFSFPKAELPFKFAPRRFSSYEELNQWKKELLNMRKRHIEKFRMLSFEKRLEWALNTGWEINRALSPKAKRIQEIRRNGGKQLLQARMDDYSHVDG